MSELLHWLFSIPPGHLAAISVVSNIMLTLGLIGFAALQWRVTDRQRKLQEAAELHDAEQEKATELRELRIAYEAARAEWFRLWSVAQLWNDNVFRELMGDDRFHPDDFLPRDFAFLAGQLARLGVNTAALGSFAITLSYDVALQARAFVQRFNYRKVSQTDADEAKIKARALEVAQLLEDALTQSVPGRQPDAFDFDESLILSGEGKRLMANLRARRDAAERTVEQQRLTDRPRP